MVSLVESMVRGFKLQPRVQVVFVWGCTMAHTKEGLHRTPLVTARLDTRPCTRP